VEQDQCIAGSHSEEEESGEERIHEFQTRDLIIVVDHEGNVDRRLVPKYSLIRKSGRRRKPLAKFRKCGVAKGASSWS
jgi:hypothetical protein